MRVSKRYLICINKLKKSLIVNNLGDIYQCQSGLEHKKIALYYIDILSIYAIIKLVEI